MESQAIHDVKRTIETVRILLSHPDRWCKQYEAKDSDGNGVGADEHEACQWCLQGAVFSLSTGKVRWDTIFMLRESLGIPTTMFNDDPDTTHKHLMEALRDAIRYCDDKLEEINATT